MTATASAVASTEAIARELVSLCRAGRNMEAIEKFYSPDIVSIESMGNAEMPAEIHGIDAVRRKNEWWRKSNEVHSTAAAGPFIGEGQFAVKYDFETTFKPTGQRMRMTEMALYDVANGKIVREHFFYNVHRP